MSRAARAWLLGTLGFIAFMALWIWLCPYFWTNVGWGLYGSLYWIIPFAALLIAVIVVGGLAASRYNKGEPYGGMTALAVAVGFFGLMGFIGWCIAHSYLVDSAYAESVTVVQDGTPQFGQRAPFQIASAQAKPDLGDSQGTISGTKYQPTTNEFSSLVVRNSAMGFVGYESVLEQKIPLTGHGTGKMCQFSTDADLRIDGPSILGFWNHNLGRAIAAQHRGLSYDANDVYGFCDKDGTPKVVVPLLGQSGFWVVTEVPAGVAIYNGKTGDLTFQNDTKGLPGASYPLSLAALQRQSTTALNGFGAWWSNTAGWDTDNEDVNSSNNAEFTLPAKDLKSAYYVTPLTGRGNATAISAISTLPTDGRNGSLATLTVHRLSTVWLSPTAIEQRIKADFSDLPGWQNNALKVEELAPVDNSHYVVTLGNDQNILYRVTGTGNLQPADKADCLERVEGDRLVQDRCGTAANVGTNGPGTQYGPNPTTTGSTGSLGDLSKLTPQQLASLEGQLQQEINRRLGVK
jgi:hypothetical protein